MDNVRRKHIRDGKGSYKQMRLRIFPAFALLSMLSFARHVDAQVYVQNGSFEGEVGYQRIPPGWNDCAVLSGTATMPHGTWQGIALPAYEGLTYLAADYHPNSQSNPHIDSISQKLSCPLAAGKKTRISMSIYTLFEGSTVGAFGHGFFKMYGGNGPCDTRELLWESPPASDNWEVYQADFVPSSNWSHITLMPWSTNGVNVGICIDALGDFYVDDYTFVRIDTYAVDSNCWSLSAESSLPGTLDFSWQSSLSHQFSNAADQVICVETDTWVRVSLQNTCGTYHDSIYLNYNPGIPLDTTSLPLLFPNAFTPNGDGRNEAFVPINSESIVAANYKIQVFNRWGMFLFESDIPVKGWDGNFEGNHQPPGTYFYSVVYVNAEGQHVKMTGDITLIR